MNLIVIALITLGAVGLFADVLLYFVSQKFKVEEDPRIDQVEDVLPGANCGGCGYPGCRGFADACVKASSLEKLFCPVSGSESMKKIGTILGMEVADADPMVAVLKCNGTCDNRPKTSKYDGSKSCQIAHNLYAGETNCSYGCIGFGDCEVVCQFDALYINPETGLPEIDNDKCTACGACIKICPKKILELRKKGPKNKRIWVACSSKDKGAVAKKACSSACIGCKKCEKVCPFDAITVENNCAYIDFNKCKLCRKCVLECPTGAILELNFPPRAVQNPRQEKTIINKIVAETKKETPIEKETPIIVEEVKIAIIEPVIIEETIIETPIEKIEIQEEKVAIVEESTTTEEPEVAINIEVEETPTETIAVEIVEKEETPEVSTTQEEPVEIIEDTEGRARNIDDIVNSILRESNYTVQESSSNFVITEENAKTEPEIDIEALILKKNEEPQIDDIFKVAPKPEATTKKEEPKEDNTHTPQQLELL